MSAVYYSGVRVLRGVVSCPVSRQWCAHLTLERPLPTVHGRDLVVLDLSLVGKVVESQQFAGRETIVVVGGFSDGWRQAIPSAYYSNDAGVSLGLVATDIAAACGEVLTARPAGSLGLAFTRAYGQAGVALSSVVGDWYVADDGRTTIGARPVGPAATGGAATLDHVTGLVTVATENPAAIRPGMTFAGSVIKCVDYVIGEKLRTMVFA